MATDTVAVPGLGVRKQTIKQMGPEEEEQPPRSRRRTFCQGK